MNILLIVRYSFSRNKKKKTGFRCPLDKRCSDVNVSILLKNVTPKGVRQKKMLDMKTEQNTSVIK